MLLLHMLIKFYIVNNHTDYVCVARKDKKKGNFAFKIKWKLFLAGTTIRLYFTKNYATVIKWIIILNLQSSRHRHGWVNVCMMHSYIVLLNRDVETQGILTDRNH